MKGKFLIPLLAALAISAKADERAMRLDYSYHNPWTNECSGYSADILDGKIIVKSESPNGGEKIELERPPLAERVFDSFAGGEALEPEIEIDDYENSLTLVIFGSEHKIISEDDDFTRIHPHCKGAELLVGLHRHIVESISGGGANEK